MPETLILDRATERWLVAGRPLHAGDSFMLEVAGGVRFAWEHFADGRAPSGCCLVDLPKGEAKLYPPAGASVRLLEDA